jgi:hypothetical protein
MSEEYNYNTGFNSKLSHECLNWLQKLHQKQNGYLKARNLNEFFTEFYRELSLLHRDAIVVNFKPIAGKFNIQMTSNSEFNDFDLLFQKEKICNNIKDIAVTFIVNCNNAPQLQATGLFQHLLFYHADLRLLRLGNEKLFETIEKQIDIYQQNQSKNISSFYDQRLPEFLWRNYLELLPEKKWNITAYKENRKKLPISFPALMELKSIFKNRHFRKITIADQLDSAQKEFLLQISCKSTAEDWKNLNTPDKETTKNLFFLTDIMLEQCQSSDNVSKELLNSCKNLLLILNETNLLSDGLIERLFSFYKITGEELPIKIFSSFGRDAMIMVKKIPAFVKQVREDGQKQRRKAE